MRKKILFGVAPKSHVLLSQDEIEGFQELGNLCSSIRYGRNDQTVGVINKLFDVIRNAFRVVFRLYKVSPDILYLNSRFDLPGVTRDFISILVIKSFYFRKLRIVIKTHGSDPDILRKRNICYKYLVFPFLISKIDAWFFLSSEEKNIINNYESSLGDRIHLTSNIVDPSRSVYSASFKKRFEIDEDKFKVLFVGRMEVEKGVFDLIRSIPLMACKNESVFVFVGEGPELDKLVALVAELDLKKQVRFTGYVEEKECDYFYGNVDVFVFPSFYKEGFSMALFKSVCAGLPVIATKIRAASDHLAMPQNVLWVESRSRSQIASSVDLLFSNKSLRERISVNNRMLANQFSKQKVCKQMQEIFDLL